MERPKKEEFVNGLTHAIGTVLSLVAACYLIQRTLPDGDLQKSVACLVYLVSLIAVYFSSMMSHWEPHEDRKIFYRRLDQAFIYFLIVASFTPFSVVHLRESYFWALLGVMWLIAIVGFLSKLWAAHRVQSVSIWVYLALGWMTLLAFVPWIFGIESDAEFPIGCLWMIFVGGIFYSGGTFFLYKDSWFWFFHAIWHVCVMLGSAIHFWAIVRYVA